VCDAGINVDTVERQRESAVELAWSGSQSVVSMVGELCVAHNVVDITTGERGVGHGSVGGDGGGGWWCCDT
jgi:hypothetical protein